MQQGQLAGRDQDRLMGRDDALDELDRLVALDHRLVAIVGPPGVGKSRLIRSWIGRGSARTENHAIVHCELAAARNARSIAPMLANAFTQVFPSGVPSASLDEAISSLATTTTITIVLDDVDPVIEPVRAFIEEALRKVPTLRIVTTSRERIHLPGEGVLDLGPLPVDDAVDLFIDRSGGRVSARRTPRKTRAEVIEIVNLLEGLPLAIELAAARTSVMSTEELAARLREQTLGLTTSVSTGSTRHSSLPQTIRWSWDLLGKDERTALAQLALFRGHFTLADAEAVLVVSKMTVIDAVQALADRSLVQRESKGGGCRLRLLGPVREFARARLDDNPGAADAIHRYSEQLVSRAETAATEYATPRGREALLELEGLASDLLAVHNAMKIVDPRLAIRAALSLLQPMRSASGGVDFSEIFATSKELAASIDDKATLATATFACGLVEMHAGHLQDAASNFQASVTLAQECADLRTEGDALVGLGALALAANEDRAASLWRDALSRYQACNDALGISNTSANLAILALEDGNIEQAGSEVRASIDAMEGSGLIHRLAFPLLIRAAVAWESDQLDLAREDARRALEIATEIHHRGHAIEARTQLALVEWAQGNYAQAIGFQVAANADASGDIAAASALLLAVMRACVGENALADGLVRVGETSLASYRGRNGLALYRTCRSLVQGKGELEPTSSYRARAACKLAEQHARRVGGSAPLSIAEEAKWFRIGSQEPISLGRRMSLRKLLWALTEQRLAHPGISLTSLDLQDRLWPSENIMPDTAANRIYVSVSKLRGMGLRRHLITEGDGYLLSTEFDVSIDVSVSDSD